MNEQGKAEGGRAGCGSLNIMFDLYLDESSNDAAFSAERFDSILRASIEASGMTLRKAFIDAWASEHSGPASLFYSLEESHVRIETWPEEGHVQGEVQLCNFSKNNEQAARQLSDRIVTTLNPAVSATVVIRRGPGPSMNVLESIVRRR